MNNYYRLECPELDLSRYVSLSEYNEIVEMCLLQENMMCQVDSLDRYIEFVGTDQKVYTLTMSTIN